MSNQFIDGLTHLDSPQTYQLIGRSISGLCDHYRNLATTAPHDESERILKVIFELCAFALANDLRNQNGDTMIGRDGTLRSWTGAGVSMPLSVLAALCRRFRHE